MKSRKITFTFDFFTKGHFFQVQWNLRKSWEYLIPVKTPAKNCTLESAEWKIFQFVSNMNKVWKNKATIWLGYRFPYLYTSTYYWKWRKCFFFSFYSFYDHFAMEWKKIWDKLIFFQISVSLTQRNMLSVGLTSIVFSEFIEEFSKISKKINGFSKLLPNISCLFSFQIFSWF